MISKDYKQLLTDHHKARPTWGSTATRWVSHIENLTRDKYCFDGLDYGCGKGALKKFYKGQTRFEEYDPGIEGKDTIKKDSYDIVVCIDVLEHVEPEHIDKTLEEIVGLAKKIVFLVISTRKAQEVLEDGRNAHLIVEDADWWNEKLTALVKVSGGRISVGRPRKDEVTITIWK